MIGLDAPLRVSQLVCWLGDDMGAVPARSVFVVQDVERRARQLGFSWRARDRGPLTREDAEAFDLIAAGRWDELKAVTTHRDGYTDDPPEWFIRARGIEGTSSEGFILCYTSDHFVVYEGSQRAELERSIARETWRREVDWKLDHLVSAAAKGRASGDPPMVALRRVRERFDRFMREEREARP